MGSKLTVLAAVILLGGTAAADAPGAAALKKGVDLYKAGKYAEARVQLEKAYKADPNPNTLFTLAQAERLAGDCMAAANHYKQVISEVGDLNVAKLVQQNLRLCEPEEDEKPAPKQEPAKNDFEPKRDTTPVEPRVVEKTVVVEQNKTDKLAAVLLGGGMLALGAAGGLYLAASGNSDAADLARSLPDHDALADKAKSQRTMMYVAGGAGVVMLGVAIFRFATGGTSKSETRDAGVAVTPNPNGSGASVLLTSHF